MTNKALRTAVLAAAVVSGLALVPAQAGEQELALLSSYVGNWKGAGELVGAKSPNRSGVVWR